LGTPGRRSSRAMPASFIIGGDSVDSFIGGEAVDSFIRTTFLAGDASY
jgi:hypothetical protein